MKKTVSVNIKGINFIIEEEAYELLENYLKKLTIRLQNQQGSEEIIEDIEIRISELLREKLDNKREVVEYADVNDALDALGDPSDFVDNDDENESYRSEENENKWYESIFNKGSEKRLYRDIENAKIAGVCSGISNYLGIDPIIMRLIWIVSFLFFGFGFLLYIILWIVIPEANSSIERLKMKGKPITVESVREEVENAAKNITKSSQKFASHIKSNPVLGNVVQLISRIFNVIFASISLLMGLSLLILLIVFFFGAFEMIPAKSSNGFLSFPQVIELVIPAGTDGTLAWIGGLLVAISAILFLFIAGFLVLFKIRNRWSKIALSGLFITGIIGFVCCIIVGVKTSRDLAILGEIEIEVASIYTDQLTIEPISSYTLKYSKNRKIKIANKNDSWLADLKKGRIYNTNIQINYRESKDSNYHIISSQRANGSSNDKAVKRASNILHNIKIYGSKVFMPTSYSFPSGDKFRNQNLELFIEIPKYKTVIVNDRIIRVNQSTPVTQTRENDVFSKGKMASDGTIDWLDE